MKTMVEKTSIYDLPIAMNCAVMYEFSVDKALGQKRKPPISSGGGGNWNPPDIK